MPRKSGNSPENAGSPPESDASAAVSQEGAGAQLGSRLSVQLDGDGRIAWDRMRADTKDKLVAAAAGDATLTGNVLPFTPKAATEKFPPQLAEVLYDSLSVMMMGLAQRGGYSQDEAAVLAFQPNEKAALVPPTLAVLDKYNASLGQYQEEIVLGTLLVTIITGKLTLLRKRAEIREFPSGAQVTSPSQGTE